MTGLPIPEGVTVTAADCIRANEEARMGDRLRGKPRFYMHAVTLSMFYI